MIDYMKRIMRENFPKYKIIQTGATIKQVVTLNREIVSEKKWLGVTVQKIYKYNKNVIPFVDFYLTQINKCSGLLKTDRHQMFIAVDYSNKIVYWNYESLPNE